ncbi:MAG TPA: sigma-70 family RNA polymerase sigma factor [Thermoanaerobaculia bacterium]|nr:sigma-70 family RNA polymerase sigma factor [Thermoanaerobaculia bacterium]
MSTSDESLVQETLAGRLEAFDELMKRYERLVFKLAWGFARNRQDALDLTQQVFMKAYRSLRSFRQDANLKTWLMRIAYNEGVSWLRQKSRAAEGDGESLDLIPTAGTQEQQLLSREREQLIERELGKLNDRYRLAITLRYRQGLPIEEIAAVLQCSEGTTKSMLFRGVRALRDALAGAV